MYSEKIEYLANLASVIFHRFKKHIFISRHASSVRKEVQQLAVESKNARRFFIFHVV